MKLTGLSTLATKSKYLLKVNSPKIKVVAGIGLGITAAVLACRATLKAKPVVDELKDDIQSCEDEFKDVADENDPKAEVEARKVLRKEETRITFKAFRKLMVLYAGPSMIGVGSILLILNGFGELNTRYLEAVATAGVFQSTLEQYRKRVAEKIGKHEEQDLYHGITYGDAKVISETDGKVKELKKAPLMGEDVLGPTSILFCKRNIATREGSIYFNDKRYDLNLLFLKNAQIQANERLKNDGFLTVYTLLTDYLGMDPQALKCPIMALNWGWKYTFHDDDSTSDNYVDFGIWDAYWRYKSDDVPDHMHGYDKDIFLDLNAVPLFTIDTKKENKLLDVVSK